MEATLSPETYLEMLGDWPAAVGRFVLAFSSCEYWTYVYLQQLGTRSVRAELANSKLSVRVERILKLARERGVAQDLYAEICLVSKRLRILAKQRNFAAHNAPMAHVFESLDTGQLEIRFEIRGVNNSERLVTQDALLAWFKDAVALENDLALLAGRISKATSE